MEQTGESGSRLTADAAAAEKPFGVRLVQPPPPPLAFPVLSNSKATFMTSGNVTHQLYFLHFLGGGSFFGFFFGLFL